MDNSEMIELAQHKLIILYIIKGANHLFVDEELSRFILENDLLNYFFLQQYITELLESNLISIDNDNCYFITEDGTVALDLFINKIPQDILSNLKNEITEFKKNKIKDQSVISQYYKDDYDRFYVDLSIKENESVIFSLNFEVPTEDYAKIICNNFKEFPENFYLKVINIFDI